MFTLFMLISKAVEMSEKVVTEEMMVVSGQFHQHILHRGGISQGCIMDVF